MSTEYIMVGVGIVVSILGWLLSQKDEKQGKEIATLFALHKEDSEKLARLELVIAKDHYEKPEVDRIVNNLKGFLDERFDRIEKMVEKRTSSRDVL